MSGRTGFTRALTGYTFIGLAKWLWRGATGREAIVTGECLQCGGCCRALNLSRKNHWIRTEAEFRRLASEYPEYNRFTHTGYTVGGIMTFSCGMVGEDGLCSDYENRPELCRAYPEPDLCYMGAGLPASCGYRIQVVPSFHRMLKRRVAEVKRSAQPQDNQNDRIEYQ